MAMYTGKTRPSSLEPKFLVALSLSGRSVDFGGKVTTHGVVQTWLYDG